MRRGSIVLAVGKGDFSGKPRPALVVQTSLYNASHGSIVVCPLTTRLAGELDFRVPVSPDASNGLAEASEVQVDKLQAVKREHIGAVVGRADAVTLSRVDHALRRWLEL